MLRTLRIRDLVIIEDLTVDFGQGLNLLTGETGAGKSILVDALCLAAGERTDRSQIRTGSERAVVEALFELERGSAAHAFACESGLLEPEDVQLVVRREVSRSGAGRILVNGSPCALGVLRELGELALELHGQHEHLRLAAAERHLELLDLYGGHDLLRQRVAAGYTAARRAGSDLEELSGRARSAAARSAECREALGEIEALGPRPGEIAEIDRERQRLRNAGRIAELVDEVVQLAYEGEPAAGALAALAARRADELAALDPTVEELAARLGAAAVEIEDVGAAFRDWRDRTDFDPLRLEALESRRVAIERLCQRRGRDEAGLVELSAELDEELRGLADLETELETAERGLLGAEKEYAAACDALTRARREAAAALVAAVQGQLGALALERARFDVAFAPARGPALLRFSETEIPLRESGAERTEFLFAANPGEPFRPLGETASGGELSRVMLALHVVVEGVAAGRVLIFDEVDAGIGGAVADAVGARLALLARASQVLCVTHLPQVAAYADRHFRVTKAVVDGRTHAAIEELAGPARVEELSRMLGGREATAASRRAASELLAAASRPPETPARRRA